MSRSSKHVEKQVPPLPAPDVVTFGEAFVALVAEPDVPLSAATRFTRHVVGSEANSAIGLARLGHTVAFIGKVGGDGFGSAVASRLRGEGVDVTHLTVAESAATGLMVRELRSFGASEASYYRRGSAGSMLRAEEVEAAQSLIDGARWLHLTGITPALSPGCAAATDAAVALAEAAGVTISLNVNLRRKLWDEPTASTTLRPIAARCSVVIGSAEEIELVGGSDHLLSAGVRTVVTTLGGQGSAAATSDGKVTRDGVAVPQVVDPVGAGDAFTAGFISGQLDGLSLPDCLDLANLCGAASVSTRGDNEGLPTRAELASMSATSHQQVIR